MKYIYILMLFLSGVYTLKAQPQYKTLLWGYVDSNYNEIIFNNYWRFDSIITKKLFGYEGKPYTRGIIYDFNRTNTRMCNEDTVHQVIPTTWMTVGTEVLLLTFNVGVESTRWQVIKVTEDRIVFRNWYPPDSRNNSYPYSKYKKGKMIFVFKRQNDGCG